MGAVVGVLFVVVFIEEDASVSDWAAAISVAALVGAAIGAFVGVPLGLVVGGMLGTVAVRALMPYPGRRRARRTIRVWATGFVLMIMAALAHGAGWELFTVLIVALSTVGAWFASPLVVDAYISRQEHADAG